MKGHSFHQLERIANFHWRHLKIVFSGSQSILGLRHYSNERPHPFLFGGNNGFKSTCLWNHSFAQTCILLNFSTFFSRAMWPMGLVLKRLSCNCRSASKQSAQFSMYFSYGCIYDIEYLKKNQNIGTIYKSTRKPNIIISYVFLNLNRTTFVMVDDEMNTTHFHLRIL